MIDHALTSDRDFGNLSAESLAPAVNVGLSSDNDHAASWPQPDGPLITTIPTTGMATSVWACLTSVVLHGAICAALVLVWPVNRSEPAASEIVSIEIVADAAPPEPEVQEVKEVQPDETPPEINVAESIPAPPDPAPVVLPVPVQVAQAQTPVQPPVQQRQDKPKPKRKQEQAPRQARESNGTTEQRVARSATPPASYLGQVAAMLHRAKVYPASARERGEQGRAVIRFTILRSGNAAGAVLVQSSGNSTLDQAASSVIARAAPFPPLPDSYALPTISVTVPIEYSLR